MTFFVCLPWLQIRTWTSSTLDLWMWPGWGLLPCESSYRTLCSSHQDPLQKPGKEFEKCSVICSLDWAWGSSWRKSDFTWSTGVFALSGLGTETFFRDCQPSCWSPSLILDMCSDSTSMAMWPTMRSSSGCTAGVPGISCRAKLPMDSQAPFLERNWINLLRSDVNLHTDCNKSLETEKNSFWNWCTHSHKVSIFYDYLS